MAGSKQLRPIKKQKTIERFLKETGFSLRATNQPDFLKIKTSGKVTNPTNAETKNTSPTNPAERPNPKAAAAKTGATLCAAPAIAHATPNVPPCADSVALTEINVLNVAICSPKPNAATADTANKTAKEETNVITTMLTAKHAMPSKIIVEFSSFLLSCGNRIACVKTPTAPMKKKTNPVCSEP